MYVFAFNHAAKVYEKAGQQGELGPRLKLKNHFPFIIGCSRLESSLLALVWLNIKSSKVRD